jgi:hypothetical protein
MFNLDILQNQWVIVALFGGAAAALIVVLAYLAIWRTGGSPGGPAPETSPVESHSRGRVPWVLIVLYAAAIVYAVVYVSMKIIRPPTW